MAKGHRLVTITCTALDEDSFDLLYSFDKDFELSHLRLKVIKNALLPSITGIYFAAFLVENEIQDLFGLRFSGLALDYKGTLYLDEEITNAPFCKYALKEERSSAVKAEAPAEEPSS
jgi:ech hydrogenase subunit D